MSYSTYIDFFQLLKKDVSLKKLPEEVKKKLKPYFKPGTLDVARYGFSSKLPDGIAVNDCSTIYFSDMAAGKNRTNGIGSDKNLEVLLHELVHVEHCRYDFTPSDYALWWSQLDDSIIQQVSKAVGGKDSGFGPL